VSHEERLAYTLISPDDLEAAIAWLRPGRSLRVAPVWKCERSPSSRRPLEFRHERIPVNKGEQRHDEVARSSLLELNDMRA